MIRAVGYDLKSSEIVQNSVSHHQHIHAAKTSFQKVLYPHQKRPSSKKHQTLIAHNPKVFCIRR